MFTERNEEDEQTSHKVEAGDTGTTNPKPVASLEVEAGSGRLAKAIERHEEVEMMTRRMMMEWVVLLSVNMLMHFMRMSVVMLYCINRFDVSEFKVGLMTTVHMLIMAVANSYICLAIDRYPFEPLMTARFTLLVCATLGEYLANSFVIFSLVYCAASISIVWFGVQPAYFIQMLPSRSAKNMTHVGLIINKLGVLIGLALGGCVGGLISMRGVFLVSFIVSVLSLIWIVFFLRGKENRIRYIQATEISQMYRDFPDHFNDSNERFPMPFADQLELFSEEVPSQINNDDYSQDKSDVEEIISSVDHSKEEETTEIVNAAEEADENQPMLPNNNSGESSKEDLDLLSTEAIPFWVLTVRNGINAAASTEFVAWWNVYAHQVFDASLAASSAQCVVAIVAGLLIAIPTLRIFKPQSLGYNRLINVGAPISIAAAVSTALLFLLVFPLLSFKEMWGGIIMTQVLFGFAMGFPSSMQIAESPPKVAGKLFAVLIALRSFIPAVQHVIIGLLWAVGGHGWVYRWFGILYVLSGLTMFMYFVLRRVVYPKDDAELLIVKSV